MLRFDGQWEGVGHEDLPLQRHLQDAGGTLRFS